MSMAPTVDSKSHAFAGAVAMLAPHLAELDRYLDGQLAEFEPEIRALVDECINLSGKRIPPALVFLSGWHGPTEIAPDLVRGAAVVELIRLATLVHGDLTDEAEHRRTWHTTSREFSPTPAVLLGDALFAHGLHLATQLPTKEICAAITASTRRVCAGEIVQTLRSIDMTRAYYQRIVELKTADLFRVCCFIGARLAGSEAGYVEAVSRFGRHLGIACRMYDDLVDGVGAETRIGKTLGPALASGELTLPLLVLFERLPAAEANTLRAEIAGERPSQPALRRRQMRELAIFPVIAEAVQAEILAATAELREWPGQPPTPQLLGLCERLQAELAAFRQAGAATGTIEPTP